MNPVLMVTDHNPGRGLWVWCPGCGEAHRAQTIGTDGRPPTGPCWDWDGNVDAPTISPSLLVGGVQWAEDEPFHKPGHAVAAGASIVCHSFIRAGKWEFLTDSTHDLAGQTVPMVPLPDYYFPED